MSWSVRANFDLDALAAKVEAQAGDICADALTEEVLPRALEMVPKRTGDLADSAEVRHAAGGAEIAFTSVYARWVHEHLGFKHPFGGTAKFLEVPMVEREGEVLDNIADHVRRLL